MSDCNCEQARRAEAEVARLKAVRTCAAFCCPECGGRDIAITVHELRATITRVVAIRDELVRICPSPMSNITARLTAALDGTS